MQQKAKAIREAVIALATAAPAQAPKNSKPAGKREKKKPVYLGICARSIIFASSLHKNTSALLFVCLVVVRMCFVSVISSFLPCRLFKYPIFNSLCKQFTYSFNSLHSIRLFVVLPLFGWFVFSLSSSSSSPSIAYTVNEMEKIYKNYATFIHEKSKQRLEISAENGFRCE